MWTILKGYYYMLFKESSIKKTSARVGQEEAGTCGDGGLAKEDVQIWFKIKVFNCSITVRNSHRDRAIKYLNFDSKKYKYTL